MSEVRTPPIRLVDLNPRWIRTTDGKIYGIAHDCPCRLPKYDPQVHGIKQAGQPDPDLSGCCSMLGSCVVPTKATFEPGATVCEDSQRRGWDTTGTSFEDITLAPSVHHVGHWHGFIRAGWLESC